MDKKILVIGEKIIDKHIYGETTRLGPDAPYPIFIPEYEVENWGGAGNVVNNLKSLAPEYEIDFIHNYETITKTRYVDKKSNYILMRVDENDKVNRLFDRTITELIYDDKFSEYKAIVFSEYGKGLLAKDDILKISKRAKLVGIPTFLDTKHLLGLWAEHIFITKINEVEWKHNLRNNVNPAEYCENLIVSVGERGAVYRDKVYPVA